MSKAKYVLQSSLMETRICKLKKEKGSHSRTYLAMTQRSVYIFEPNLMFKEIKYNREYLGAFWKTAF